MKSQARAISVPPPRAKPLTLAMMGLPRSSIWQVTVCSEREKLRACTGFISLMALMSAPATKALRPRR
jgi:hypothetical protein